MIRFECDYTEGMHPKILEALTKTNMEQHPGYGTDIYCENARNLIKKACKRDDIDVYFLGGGTLSNLTIISSILRTHEGVISPTSGHIETTETGAIEATGHKILNVPSYDGKLKTEDVVALIESHLADGGRHHTVKPGMLYISQATEFGTTYTKAELKELYEVCQKYDIPLFVDGARLGYAIASDTGLALEDYAKYSDIFYIGGTKVGAAFGEAVVITNDKYKSDFNYVVKQKGALLAKGRFLGIQFMTLFEDVENPLYLKISKHAVDLALQIRKACQDAGFNMAHDSYSNQQFPILPNEKIAEIKEKYSVSDWGIHDDKNGIIRICTSWATKAEDVTQLIEILKS